MGLSSFVSLFRTAGKPHPALGPASRIEGRPVSRHRLARRGRRTGDRRGPRSRPTAGSCMRTGLGTVIDVGGTLLLGIVLVALSILLVMLGLTLLRRMPRRFVAAIVVALICIVGVGGGFGYSPGFAVHLAGPPVALIALAGAGLSVLLRRGSGRAGIVHGVLGSLMLACRRGPCRLAGFLDLAPGEDPVSEGHRAGRQPYRLLWMRPIRPCRARMKSPRSSTEAARTAIARNTARRWISGPIPSMRRPSSTNLSGFKAWARKKYWGFEPNRLSAQRPRLVSQGRRPLPAGPDRPRQPQDGGVLRPRATPTWASCWPSRGYHRGFHRRELPQRQLGRRHRRRERRPRVAAAQAPGAVARPGTSRRTVPSPARWISPTSP